MDKTEKKKSEFQNSFWRKRSQYVRTTPVNLNFNYKFANYNEVESSIRFYNWSIRRGDIITDKFTTYIFVEQTEYERFFLRCLFIKL